MIRLVLAAFLLSISVCSSAFAQTCSLPNTLTNGTNADANQVMANLNALLSCVNAVATPVPLRSYLAGLTLSTPGSSTNFGVAAGVATSADSTTLMKLATSVSKTTSAWAAGSGNGALDTGTIANSTWYHVYLIENVTSGAVDVLISLSPSNPTMPSGYAISRRIGSMKINTSGQWILFHQLGDEFLWDVAPTDVNGATTSTTSTALTLSVPTGVQVLANINARADFSTASCAIFFSSLDVSDQTAGGYANMLVPNSTSTNPVNTFLIRTSTSGQIRVRGNSTGSTYGITTNGWIDRRGRDS